MYKSPNSNFDIPSVYSPSTPFIFIPNQIHVPPVSSAQDLLIIEERLKSNLLYFRTQRRHYRYLQILLALLISVGIYLNYACNLALYVLASRCLSFFSSVFLIYLCLRPDYRSTLEQAKTYTTRINRAFYPFHLVFCRQSHLPELSFSKQIPMDVFHSFDRVRKEYRKRQLNK